MTELSGELGGLVAVGTAVAGVIASWAITRTKTADNTKAIDTLTVKLDEGEKALSEFKLAVAQEYVRHGALRDMEERLAAQMKELGHTVRGTMKEILGALVISGRIPRAPRLGDDQ